MGGGSLIGARLISYEDGWTDGWRRVTGVASHVCIGCGGSVWCRTGFPQVFFFFL